MKKIKLSIYALLTGLALAGVYSCKGVSEEPVADTSKIVAETLPTVTPTTLVQPTATAGAVTQPAAATAAASAISSGTTTPELNAATAAVSKIVADPATLAAQLTALGTTAPTGALKTQLDNIIADPAVAALLSSLTLPTVNGATVSGRIGAVEAISATFDACTDGAQAVYDGQKALLDVQKTNQTATVTAAYTAALATINTNLTACNAGSKITVINASLATAATTYTAAIAEVKSKFSNPVQSLLLIVIAAQYNDFVADLTRLKVAETATCARVATTATATATANRDADLAKVTTNYNEALAKLQAAAKAAAAPCHNQGSGLSL